MPSSNGKTNMNLLRTTSVTMKNVRIYVFHHVFHEYFVFRKRISTPSLLEKCYVGLFRQGQALEQAIVKAFRTSHAALQSEDVAKKVASLSSDMSAVRHHPAVDLLLSSDQMAVS